MNNRQLKKIKQIVNDQFEIMEVIDKEYISLIKRSRGQTIKKTLKDLSKLNKLSSMMLTNLIKEVLK